MKYKLAYIDEDDGWLNTFYHTFKNDFDILLIKVDDESSLESILKITFESELDAVVTDYLLEEDADVTFNGNKIVEGIRGNKPHFPIVMLTSHEPQAISHMDDVHIIYGKSILDGESENDLQLFISKMKSNITNYYSKLEMVKADIEILVNKKNNAGLNPEEEVKLTKLFILLDEYEPEGKDLPINLIQTESITKLHDFVAQTKQILNELRKANNK